MGLWRSVVPERLDVDCEPAAARPGVSRLQYERMEQALGWCEWLTPEERRLVGAAITSTRGGARDPRWTEIRRHLATERTTDALRKAYGRALSRICGKLNAGDGSYFR